MISAKIYHPRRVILTALASVLLGCSSPNIAIDTAQPLPPVVKADKHMTLRRGQIDMQNTGVFIDHNDLCSVMAAGRIDFCPGGTCKLHDIRPELGRPLIARIGRTGQFCMPMGKQLPAIVIKFRPWKPGWSG
jgi:hypothetical protein